MKKDDRKIRIMLWLKNQIGIRIFLSSVGSESRIVKKRMDALSIHFECISRQIDQSGECSVEEFAALLTYSSIRLKV